MKAILYFTKRIHHFSGRTLYTNLIGMILISLFEGVGIFLLVPLISITEVFEVNLEKATPLSWFSGLFQGIPQTTSLILILGVYVLIIIAQSYFQKNRLILNSKIQQGFTRHLREETYKGIIQASWGFFLKKRKTDLINLMITETARVGSGTNMFLQFIATLVFTFIQVAIAFYLSAKITIFVLFVGLVLTFFSRRFIKRSQTLGKETIELSNTYLAGITDHFNGMKEIKSNNLEGSHLTWFSTLNKKIEHNFIEMTKLKTSSQFIYKFCSAFFIAIFVFMSVKLFHAQPTQLMLIIVIFSRLWPRLSGIQANMEQLGSIVPSFNALINLQNECNEAKELKESDDKNIKPLIIKQGLECRNVFFRYNQNQPSYALSDINLQIPSNQMTAIVGRSGAGKSTLIDLIMGLNQPEIGDLKVDGKKLTKDKLLSLRKSISYVAQDPFLFNGSVRENLLLIEPNATEDDLWEALEFSAAASFVRNLPQGLETHIGDRGIRLSGGERQRLVLARAILRKPSILVLDEATSALDTENETKIQESLERLKGKMTIIVIAHRLSTIRNADQVVVLDKGEIIQKGEFGQLASEKSGTFSNLLGKQIEAAL